ncbi:MAG: cytochrome c maturation protein CcmE [Coriobacteriia bacterium]|nr:cytochrome c maturation protein CcmE [Coriobacteriia bacterium]
MNKRARNRLIGITAIILLLILAIVFTLSSQEGAFSKTVSEVVHEEVGTRVKVTGVVVAGSWDRRTNPMRFEIRDEEDATGTGPVLAVVFEGTTVPSTFGDGVTAIVTGYITEDGSIRADEMITKCPSKYESAQDAYTVAQLKEKADQMVDIPVKVAGYVKNGQVNPPGSAVRLVLVDERGATTELNVAIPVEVQVPSAAENDDTRLVITGALDDNGLFVAVEVAVEQ